MEADGFTYCTPGRYEAKKNEAISFANLAVKGLYKGYFSTRSERNTLGAVTMDSTVAEKDSNGNEVGLDVEVLNQDTLFTFYVNSNGLMVPTEPTAIKTGLGLLIVDEGFLVQHDFSADMQVLLTSTSRELIGADQ